jgi:hypothetical protein
MSGQRLRPVAAAMITFGLVVLGSVPPAMASGTSIRPTPLHVLWRVDRDGDRTSSAAASERDALGGSPEGQLFYIPATGTNMLYRTFSPIRGDHRDSFRRSGPGGYVKDGVLGSPWAGCGALPGLAPIFDAVNPATGDHATLRPGEALPGYTVGRQLGCGYPRYGTAGEDLLTTIAGGVTVSSNRVAGGSVWRWTHRGVQYVNTYDYGREIQGAIFIDHWNPTEAGDGLGESQHPADIHGSPLLSESSGPTTQSTRAAPLEFSVNRTDAPSVWKDISLGKDLTLDFMGMGPVVQYDTVVTTSRTLVGDWQTYISAPAVFVRPVFRRYFTYDAAAPASSPQEVFPRDWDVAGVQYRPPSGIGGVVVADDTLEHAMGLYAVCTTVPGGTIEDFSMAKYFTEATGPQDESENAPGTTGMDAHSQQPIRAGTTRYRTWIITGTLAEVAALMTDLYEANVR